MSERWGEADHAGPQAFQTTIRTLALTLNEVESPCKFLRLEVT